MKLITKEILKKTPSTEKDCGVNPMIYFKLFDPCGSWTLHVAQYDPEAGIVFGYVTGMDCDEWGYSSLMEIAEFKGPLGLGMERDLYFQPSKFNELNLNTKK